ncbi:MAG TPA: ATP synthase F0 subunit A [Flavobacteriia bacterium]|nr:ATP synthase F0 subunit A [Flavobacteriia bacterium]
MLKRALYILTLITLFSISNIVAQEHHEEFHDKINHQTEKHEEHGDKHHGDENLTLEQKIKRDIDHHLLDSHSFHLTKGVEFPLPVILWDNGLHVFSSSKFDENNGVVESNGQYYAISHNNGHIYKTDSTGHIDHDEKGLETNDKPLDLSITKNVFIIIMIGLIMLLIFSNLAKSYVKNNGIASGIGRFLEPIILFIRDDIAIPNIGEKHYKKYMPYLLTIFFFVWFVNLLGLTPLGVNITGNLAVTAGLAILTYLITTFSANKNYWKHIFWMPGVPTLMKIILAPIELLGTFIKPFSLMIRLYANIMAGHVVLMTIIGLMFIFKNWIGSSLSFGLAFGLSILELLVAALQAYIFTMLSALYFGSAVEEHHHEEAH